MDILKVLIHLQMLHPRPPVSRINCTGIKYNRITSIIIASFKSVVHLLVFRFQVPAYQTPAHHASSTREVSRVAPCMTDYFRVLCSCRRILCSHESHASCGLGRRSSSRQCLRGNVKRQHVNSSFLSSKTARVALLILLMGSGGGQTSSGNSAGSST